MKCIKLCRGDIVLNQGVFWIINSKAVSYEFGSVDAPEVIAKSGSSYNHERLWTFLRGMNTGKTFDYYPRGRVVVNSRGKEIIYCSPHIDDIFLNEVANRFKLADYRIKRDYSKHYFCYLD